VKIRTFQNQLLVVSNAVLGKEDFEIAPQGESERPPGFLQTRSYVTHLAKTLQIVRDAVRQVENVSQKIRPSVRIRTSVDNGIDWEIKYYARGLHESIPMTDALDQATDLVCSSIARKLAFRLPDPHGSCREQRWRRADPRASM
jgi:hypothetical protein